MEFQHSTRLLEGCVVSAGLHLRPYRCRPLSMWVVLQKLLQLNDTHFSQVLNEKKFFLWFYKIPSPSPFHLNYTSFPLLKQQQHGF